MPNNCRFPDHSFDIVTIGYGLRNLTSWERGVDEMFRVARPGARLIVLDFGKPPNALWRALYFTHLKMSVPLIGLLLRQRIRLRLHFGIAETLSRATGRGGKDCARWVSKTPVQVINLLGGAMAINYGEKGGMKFRG